MGLWGHKGSCPAMARGRTGEVELVQAVISHGSVTGALADVGGGWRVWAQPPSTGSQPATHPEALEQVAQERPEQAAGQVPVGRRQRPPQRPERRPQVLGSLREVSLRPGEMGQCGQDKGDGTGEAGDVVHSGTYPVKVKVGLPAVPPEEDGGLRVGASDGLSTDEESHHRTQHQRHIQCPEGQCGPQPLRPPPRVLCAGMGSATSHQCCPVPTPGSPSSGLHPMSTKEPPSSRVHLNRFHPNVSASLTHTPGYPFWWPSPCAHPSSIHPMASAPCPPQLSPISDLPSDPPPDVLHPMSTMITSAVMVITLAPPIPTVFTSWQPQQPQARQLLSHTHPNILHLDGLHINSLQSVLTLTASTPHPSQQSPSQCPPHQSLPKVPDAAMMLLPVPVVSWLPTGAGEPEPRRREARGLKERQRKTKVQRAMRERSSIPWLLGEGGGCSCFTCTGRAAVSLGHGMDVGWWAQTWDIGHGI